MFEITKIDKNSVAEKFNILVGDMLLSINGTVISDVVDYKFYSYDSELLTKISRNSEILEIKILKEEGQDLGIEFETYLMDKAKSCQNKCIFCFIDQNPKDMRETIYFKDDDARLSFLIGNYITLTNLTAKDVERMVKMRLSPINISVHTTNPELRVKMLGHKRGGDSLKILDIFAENRMSMNCQIVVCPGVNDGVELKKSLYDLEKLYPNVESISIVPVGVTDHREGLFELNSVTPDVAGEIIDITESFAKYCYDKHGTNLAFCGDELYIKAKRPLRDVDYYEEFVQFQNGVGMMTLFMHEFRRGLKNLTSTKIRPFSVATGGAAYPYIVELVNDLREICGDFECFIYKIDNNFFGADVTVAGLITGGDIIQQLRGNPLGERLLISKNMLREKTDVFLDDYTLADVEKSLDIPIMPVEIDGEIFLDYICKK